MGNWHCVPSGCSEVVYQEYLPPSIRYRYPGEAWQEIIGATDYSVKADWQYETTNNFNYTFTAKARCSTSSPPPGVAPNVPRAFVTGQEIELFTVGALPGPIYGAEKTIVDGGLNVNINITYLSRTGGNLTVANCAKRTIDQTLYTKSATGSSVRVKNVAGSYSEPVVYGDIYDIKFTATTTPPRACIVAVNNSCVFKVTKNGNIIHQETRSVCPEVEKLPCRLSDQIKTIEIEKLPWLQRVEVVDYFYDVRWGGLIDSDNYGLLLSKGKIPDQCLNIYKNSITSIIPNDFISITNTPENGFDLIAQICSAPGCLPPQYQVICDCECQSCPDGTHPITCVSSVCCYGSDGKVVQEIPIDNYCGGDCCCE